MGKFALVISRAAAAIATALAIAGALPVISAVQWLLAAGGLLLFALEVVDIGRQPQKGVGSQRAVVLRCVAWLVIATTGFRLAPSLAVIVAFAAIYGLCTLTAREGPTDTTTSPRLRQRVVVLAKSLIKPLGGWSGGSITLAPSVTVFMFVLASIGAAYGAIASVEQSAHGGHSHHQHHNQRAALLATTGHGGRSIVSVATHPWKGECQTPPGSGAPLWASTAIAALYTGAPNERTGTPPGTATAGCTGKAHEMVTSMGLFIWMLGENLANGRTLSIAVDSHQFGSALFLWPAVAEVIELISRYGAIGGVRSIRAGNGNLYPVETSNGTYILIRREMGTEQVPQPYIKLPPAVATAWGDAMHEWGSWLWPLAPQTISGGEVFKLATTNHDHVVYTIFFDRKNGDARLNNHPIYRIPELELSTPELERNAQSAQ